MPAPRPPAGAQEAAGADGDALARAPDSLLARAPSSGVRRPPRLVTSWGEEEEDNDDEEDDEDDEEEEEGEGAPAALRPPPASQLPTPSGAWPLASPALVAGRARPAVPAPPPPLTASTPAPEEDDPESQFDLLDELGRGSHGAVYAAADIRPAAPGGGSPSPAPLVAVKVVAAVGADAGALAREVEALVGCAHPAVVQHIVSGQAEKRGREGGGERKLARSPRPPSSIFTSPLFFFLFYRVK